MTKTRDFITVSSIQSYKKFDDLGHGLERVTMQNETPEYVKECAQRAVNYDHARRHDAAVYFYLVSALSAAKVIIKTVLGGSKGHPQPRGQGRSTAAAEGNCTEIRG